MQYLKILILLFLMHPVFINAQSQLAKFQKKVKHSYALYDTAHANSFITVSVNTKNDAALFSPAAPDPSKRNLYNLTEKGQQALINSLGAKTGSAKELLEALPTVLEPGPDEVRSSPEVKMTDLLKKLEINVNNIRSVANSGRIAQLLLWVTLDNTNNLSTRYQSVDFGTLSLNKVHGFTINAGINLGGTGATTLTTVNGGGTSTADGGVITNNSSTNERGTTSSNTSNLGVGYSNTNTIAEQIAIKNTVLTMKGSISKNEASLQLNGVPNQDLSDNINLELVVKPVKTITVPYITLKGLFHPISGTPSAQADITVTKKYYTIPQSLTSDVKASLSYTFVYREIVSGENTVIESDDKVNYHTLYDRTITKTPFTFLTTTEINPRFRNIKIYTGAVQPASYEVLYLKYYNENIELLFTKDDLATSENIIEWLRRSGATKIGNFDLILGHVALGQPITYSNYTAASALNLKSTIK
jgi:hypothetical protein